MKDLEEIFQLLLLTPVQVVLLEKVLGVMDSIQDILFCQVEVLKL
jgi:hypothetical protein